MTKPSYEELGSVRQRLGYKSNASWELAQEQYPAVRLALELEAELLRVRGLLQRQWISVEEPLPAIGEEVLVINAGDALGQEIVAVVKRNHIRASNNADYRDFRERGYTHWMPLPVPPTFPQSSSLAPSGAESADIGKLDDADKAVPSCSIVGKTWHSELYEEGVEMGKVNRVDEKADV